MPTIHRLSALEILDSRGRPTVRATCTLASGAAASASVPSGASTGTAEALELRDGDSARYAGLGCQKAVGHVNGVIHEACAGVAFADQAALDAALIALDGTPNKARLGANALLAVSLAFARAVAVERGLPLWRHLADVVGDPVPATLPRPTINLFSGGKHAGGQVPIQDVLVVSTAPTVDRVLTDTFAVYQAAMGLSARRYGTRALVADEGGLAPPFPDTEAMLADAVAAIRAAGLEPGRDVALCVDLAASHFHGAEGYRLVPGQPPLPGAEMIETLLGWLDRYPIVSIEDGLAENDWEAWPALRTAINGQALTVGDDLLATNPTRVRRAIDLRAADALLLKVNQIGTLTEAAEARALARAAGWRVVVSARSGETEDDWLADLAVGWSGDALKVGSITRSERLAKYNRLLAIAADSGLPVVDWPFTR